MFEANPVSFDFAGISLAPSKICIMHIQIIHESITTGDLYKVKPSAEVQNQKGDKGVLGFV